MAASSPRLTVQIVDPSTNLSELPMEKMVYRMMKVVRCAFPDESYCNGGGGGDNNIMVIQYEDLALFIMSFLITVFLLTFVILDLNKRIKRFLFQTLLLLQSITTFGQRLFY